MHKHHIIPKHAGGTDDPENIVELTVLDHAIAHRVLWKLHGRWQDKVAWEMLRGQTDNPMKIREMAEKVSKTRKKLIKEGKITKEMATNKPETLDKSAKRWRINNPNKGYNNHTAYPIKVIFEDGTEQKFDYMKQAAIYLNIPYTSMKLARRKGLAMKKYKIQRIEKWH